MEQDKGIETPGGMDYLKKWNGEGVGLPFLVILDATGKKLIDSNRPIAGKPGENIGYPAAPEEIAHFVLMMKKTSRLTSGETSKIGKWLKEHAPKP